MNAIHVGGKEKSKKMTWMDVELYVVVRDHLNPFSFVWLFSTACPQMAFLEWCVLSNESGELLSDHLGPACHIWQFCALSAIYFSSVHYQTSCCQTIWRPFSFEARFAGGYNCPPRGRRLYCQISLANIIVKYHCQILLSNIIVKYLWQIYHIYTGHVIINS